MTGPVAALIGNGSRLHLQHGPIDLIIGADPVHRDGRQEAFEAAARRFQNILTELVDELPLLRSPVCDASACPVGCVAQRMHAAVTPFAKNGFVTPMAAVAGSVADEVLDVMTSAVPLRRAYVNNGGDIALHLTPGENFTAAMASIDGRDMGRVEISPETGVGGIATSGQGGRSHSFGIADSVTVLAKDAARADAGATLIANAVDLSGHPAIARSPANELNPDSDLGARPVVTHVGKLCPNDVSIALEAGAKFAQTLLRRGLISGAALSLRGEIRMVGTIPTRLPEQTGLVEHA